MPKQTKTKAKTKQQSTTSKLSKYVCIGVCAAAFITVAVFTIVTIINAPRRDYVSSDHSEEKINLKEHVSKISFLFDSYPHETRVVYDFKNKTKTIQRDTDRRSEKETVEVSYRRFDELYDYIYDKVFTNNANLQRNSDCCAIKSVYDIYVEFDSSEERKPIGSSFHGYLNNVSKRYEWGLNGHVFPEGWASLLKIAEIDNSVFGDNGFNLEHTPYEEN